MNSSSFPDDTEMILVADASVIINLNATGRAMDILTAYPGTVVVTTQALDELLLGGNKGYSDGKKLQELIEVGRVRAVCLGEAGSEVYFSLVNGPAVQTLDDGEAATIGYADETGAVAIIDEKKARAICQKEFPQLQLKSSVDLLMHNAVVDALGREAHVASVVSALKNGRMRVLPHQQEMIVTLIGLETAAGCNSLPKAVRRTDLTTGTLFNSA
ncbi:hypothetical protein [Geomonas paludis]|uniref:Uncharacterized protein n=1 Tax=Geomonas paludis TaxID=2740185 RepID=A0A6V8MV01_9BACT|nr:hypothetical protein [Geomonas paludis]GFO63159.1 hypothetical protein GMPD_10780 [Geomonas paludis]